MLIWVEHEKSFITSGPGFQLKLVVKWYDEIIYESVSVKTGLNDMEMKI